MTKYDSKAVKEMRWRINRAMKQICYAEKPKRKANEHEMMGW